MIDSDVIVGRDFMVSSYSDVGKTYVQTLGEQD